MRTKTSHSTGAWYIFMNLRAMFWTSAPTSYIIHTKSCDDFKCVPPKSPCGSIRNCKVRKSTIANYLQKWNVQKYISMQFVSLWCAALPLQHRFWHTKRRSPPQSPKQIQICHPLLPHCSKKCDAILQWPFTTPIFKIDLMPWTVRFKYSCVRVMVDILQPYMF